MIRFDKLSRIDQREVGVNLLMKRSRRVTLGDKTKYRWEDTIS